MNYKNESGFSSIRCVECHLKHKSGRTEGLDGSFGYLSSDSRGRATNVSQEGH